jgi:hypothetical protein
VSTPQSRFDLSDIAEPSRVPARSVRPVRPRPDKLDLSDIADPSSVPSKSSNPYGAFDSQTEGQWSISDAPKLKDWYSQTYGKDLPVSAFGESETHRAMGLDHSNSLDVALSPTSDEGKAFIAYLKQNNIPFLAYDRAVPGAATAAHIHVGFPSHGGVPAAFDLSDIAEDAPTQADDYGPPVKIEQATSGATGETLALNDRRRQIKPDTSEALPVETRLAPLPQRKTFDNQTMEGRQARDERNARERTQGATLEVDVPLPKGRSDFTQSNPDELVRSAYTSAAAARGVPREFVEKWMRENAPTGYSLHTGAGAEVGVADVINADDYDPQARTLRVKLDAQHLSKIVDDFKLALAKATGIPGMENAKSFSDVDPVTRTLVDPDTSPGEGFVAATSGFARGVGKTAEPIMRVPQAASAGFFAGVRGDVQGGPEVGTFKALHSAYQTLKTGETPPEGKNIIGEWARDSKALAAINPRLPKLLGMGADIVLDPVNLIPLGLGGRLTRALGEGGRLAEGARDLGLFERGFVNPSPLGIEGAAAEELNVVLRARNGNHFLFNTKTSDLIDLSTGELLDVDDAATAHRFGVNATAEELKALQEGASRRAPLDAELFERSGMELPEGYAKDGDVYRYHHSNAQPRDDAGRFSAGAIFDERLDAASAFVGELEMRGYTSATDLRRAEQQFLNAVREETTEAAVRARLSHVLEESFPAKDSARVGGLPEALDELSPEAARFRDKLFEQTKQSPLWKRALQGARDVVTLPKAKAGFDLSATGRQALPQILAHPTYFADAMEAQVKSFASKDAFNTFVESIKQRPDFKLMEESGLFLSSPGGVSEEVFVSGLSKKIPGVAASDQAYSAALDSVRVQAWDNYTQFVSGRPNVTRETYKAIAELINISTGRGIVPILDRSALGRKIVDLLNVPFFSPRNTAAKFGVLSPVRVVRNALNPATRPVAYLQMRDAMRGLATLSTTVGLLYLAGLDVTVNPLKSDFGKLRVGNAVYDLTGGEAASVRYLAQMARSFRTIEQGKKPPRGQTPFALTAHYLRSQLQPAASVVVDAEQGKTFEGKPFTKSQAAADLVVPFVVEDAYKGWVDAGGSTVSDAVGGKDFHTAFGGAARGLPGVFGVGTNFYPKRGTKRFDLSDIAEPAQQPVTNGANVGNAMRPRRLDLSDIAEDGP